MLPGSASKANNQVVQDFLERQQSQIKLKENMSLEHSLLYQSDGHDRKNGTESFAEKYSKFTVRDYTNNTRLNIKNAEYLAQQEKRNRMVNYWQNEVIPNHLPPIS